MMSHAAPLACLPSGEPRLVRVLIVDDSAVARAALTRMIADASQFDVVAALDSARRAIDWLRGSVVDIVLLDIQMPGLDGIAALPELIAVCGSARVLIVSTLAETDAQITLAALAQGATDVIAKPAMGAMGRHFGKRLIEKMLRLGLVEAAPFAAAEATQKLREAPSGPIECLAIGASTGGLHALAEFFGALPAAFDAPILITQHLPPTFMPFFAAQVERFAGRPTRVAANRQPLKSGDIAIAPGESHLGLKRTGGRIEAQLIEGVAETRCRPSVDPMFASVGDAFGEAALGVILTGMGRDGEIGARAMVQRGGTVIAQDITSSAVWGMPGSIARAGLASRIGPPADLARYAGRRGAAA